MATSKLRLGTDEVCLAMFAASVMWWLSIIEHIQVYIISSHCKELHYHKKTLKLKLKFYFGLMINNTSAQGNV